MDILALLQPIQPNLSNTDLRRFSRIAQALLECLAALPKGAGVVKSASDESVGQIGAVEILHLVTHGSEAEHELGCQDEEVL